MDHRADIYSLGVVFYEMLTGELPLGKFQPPSRKVQVDVRLDEVVLHALEKEPERRYQQASQVKTDVETIMSPAPPQIGSLGALPPTLASRDRRGGKRRKCARIAVGALALLIGLGALLIVLGLWATRGIAPPPGLLAWWPLDGNAADVAGGHNGAAEGSYNFAPAEVGQGIYLEGPRSGISVPDSPDLNFGPDQDFSIEAWVQPLASETEFGVMDIVDKRDAPDLIRSHGYAMALRNGKLCFLIADSLDAPMLNWEQNGRDLRDGRWHHVAATVQRDSSEGVNLYVDGQVIATFDPTPAQGDLATERPLLIGMHQSHPWFQGNFRGGLDEVSLYKRALRPAEIQAIFAAGHYGKRKLADITETQQLLDVLNHRAPGVSSTQSDSRPKAQAATPAPLAEPPSLRFLAWQDEWKTNQPGAARHPDGSPVTDATELRWLRAVPPGGVGVGGRKPQPQPRFLHLWFSHPALDGTSLNEVSLPDGDGRPIQLGGQGSVCTRTQDPDDRNGSLGWFTTTLSPGEGTNLPSRVTVRLRYTAGPLERIQELAVTPHTQASMSLEGGSELNGVGQNVDGRAFVAIAVDAKRMQSRQFDVVAVTKDGRELPREGSGSFGPVNEGIRAEHYRFQDPAGRRGEVPHRHAPHTHQRMEGCRAAGELNRV